MPRETFERELNSLQDEILALGNMAEQAVMGSVDALTRRDFEASRKIFAADQHINEKRYEIEHECLAVIATQQPMARDLRLLAAILEVITELERIGDYAKGICRINFLLGDTPRIEPMDEITQMAEIGLGMLRRALAAFVARDAQAARQIPDEDDAIDKLYNQIYHEMLQIMIKDSTSIDHANYVIWAAHNLERLGDRVTNICERIVFVVTGEIMELDRVSDLNKKG